MWMNGVESIRWGLAQDTITWRITWSCLRNHHWEIVIDWDCIFVGVHYAQPSISGRTNHKRATWNERDMNKRNLLDHIRLFISWQKNGGRRWLHWVTCPKPKSPSFIALVSCLQESYAQSSLKSKSLKIHNQISFVIDEIIAHRQNNHWQGYLTWKVEMKWVKAKPFCPLPSLASELNLW